MFELDSEDSDEMDMSLTYGPVFSPDIQTKSDNNVNDIFSSSIMSESSDPIYVGLTNAISDCNSSLPSTSSYNDTGEVNAESRVKAISDKELNLPLLKKTRVHVPLESPRSKLEELVQARKKHQIFLMKDHSLCEYENIS